MNVSQISEDRSKSRTTRYGYLAQKFIKTASGTIAIGVAAGSAGLQVNAAAQQTSNLTSGQPEEQRRGDMVFRRLGRTGEWVSLVGLGGNQIGKLAATLMALSEIRTG